MSAFLPTLERAFGTTTGTLTSIMGGAELAGLTTALAGRSLDRGRHRRIFVGALLLVSVSSAVALGGTTLSFAIAMVLLIIGVSNLTVAGLAFIGDTVPYSARGRAIGIYETSWAISLLVGAPALAFVLDHHGWRAAYILLAAITTIGAAWTMCIVPAMTTHRTTPTRPGPRQRLPRNAWPPLFASAGIAGAGISVFVVTGVWLDEAHGLSVSGLGIIATVIGGFELASSSSVAVIADRVGIRRSVAGGSLLLGIGLGVIALSGSSTPVAIGGLLILVIGFEYGFVSSLSLMSEAAPEARGTALAVGNALGTITRSLLIVLSGQAFEQFGILGTATLSALALGGAGAALVIDRRRVVGD